MFCWVCCSRYNQRLNAFPFHMSATYYCINHCFLSSPSFTLRFLCKYYSPERLHRFLLCDLLWTGLEVIYCRSDWAQLLCFTGLRIWAATAQSSVWHTVEFVQHSHSPSYYTVNFQMRCKHLKDTCHYWKKTTMEENEHIYLESWVHLLPVLYSILLCLFPQSDKWDGKMSCQSHTF